MDENILFVDIETDSKIDLPQTGSGPYFADPETCIKMLCYAEGKDSEPVVVEDPEDEGFRKALADAKYLVAHNAVFDFMGLGIEPDTDKKLICTMSMCALLNIGSSLKEACKTINETHFKLEWPAMLKDATKNKTFDYGNATDEQKEALREYNQEDVAAMRELFYNLKDWITDREFKAIDAHLRINLRGIPFNEEELERALEITAKKKEYAKKEFAGLTNLLPTQVQQFRNWLNDRNGTGIKTLIAKQLKVWEPQLDETSLQALSLRHEFVKGDHKDLEGVAKRVCPSNYEGRVVLKDPFIFGGAVTGRWTSRGANMQNNTRGGLVKELVQAPEGWHIYVADFVGIELRLALWLAGDLENVRKCHETDFYKEVASEVFGKPVDEIDKQERFFGKQLALGCNYGLGGKKFAEYCGWYGSPISEKEGQRLVTKYRKTTGRHVEKVWKELWTAASQAVRTKGKKFVPKRVSGVSFVHEGPPYGRLRVKLPTGRTLYYWNAHFEKDEYGNNTIAYFDPRRQSGRDMGRQATSFIKNGGHWLENLAQAVSRDLLARALVRFEGCGKNVRTIAHVHDEVVVLVKKGSEYDKNEVMDDMMIGKEFKEGGGKHGLLLAVDSHFVERWGDAK